MQLRLVDEVLDLGARGVALLCDEEGAAVRPGQLLRDARGNAHRVASVAGENGLLTLHIPGGDAAYFGRLFRDVRVDGPLFTVEDAP